MPPQNGSCVKHCAAGFVAPMDWDPAARPPPGKKNTDLSYIFKSAHKGEIPPVPTEEEIKALSPVPPSDVKFDEKTGTVTVTYPKDYKGCVAPWVWIGTL